MPLFDEVENYLAEGLCPGGTRRNLEFAAPHACFAPGLDKNRQLLLADAQTSGGLLIAMPEAALDDLLAALEGEGALVRAVVGRVTEAATAGAIEVS